MIIAIDGHSSCGKSTLAKALAATLGYVYVDSGAMYRAVTLYFLDNGIDHHNAEAVEQALKDIHIRFASVDGQNHTFLNNVDVERNIREMRVSEHVSPVAARSAVRRAMVEQQQLMGQHGNVVMDGRDIGTVVFPNADLKIFLTADVAIRASRRHLELAEKNIDADWDTILNNLQARDLIDSTRSDSPLRQAEDAVLLDNTHLSEEEQLSHALELVRQHAPVN
ncbi:MAG: (d)CMP kinase [Saprospiraceae bacterium]